MRIIQTDKAPAAVGPYSQAIETDCMLFLSGQLGLDPATGKLAQGFAAQVRQVLQNIKAVLAETGLDLNAVVNSDVFLTDLSKFAEFNAIYAEFFVMHKPCRTTVQVAGLPLGAEVEIRCTAMKP